MQGCVWVIVMHKASLRLKAFRGCAELRHSVFSVVEDCRGVGSGVGFSLCFAAFITSRIWFYRSRYMKQNNINMLNLCLHEFKTNSFPQCFLIYPVRGSRPRAISFWRHESLKTAHKCEVSFFIKRGSVMSQKQGHCSCKCFSSGRK